MIGLFLPFLRKWWKEIFIILVIAGGWFYYKHLVNTIDDQRTQIAQLETAKQILEDNNKKLIGAIDANNAAINKLAESTDATKKNFAALGSTVKTQNTNLEARLRAILAEKKPLTCDDTIQYLIDAVKDYPK